MSVAVGRPDPLGSRGRGERRWFGPRIRRVGLATFFVSVAVNAALGIYAVLTPDFGETQGKILGTSLCVTGAVLLGLACEPAWERRLLGPVPVLGAALGAAGFALAVAQIWAEPEGDVLGKLTGTTLVLAVGCVTASVLRLARLAPRHRWVLWTALALLGASAAMWSVLPWLSDPGEWYLRSFGVVGIFLAAFAVTVPVLHWIDRGAVVASTPTEAVRYCPYCGRAVEGGVGEDLRCGRCGRGFAVTARSST